MNQPTRQRGRTGIIVMVILILAAGAMLLFYSERAVPPQPSDPLSSDPQASAATGAGDGPDGEDAPPATDEEIRPLRPEPVVPASDPEPRSNPPVEVADRTDPSGAGLDSAEASDDLRARLGRLLDADQAGLVAEQQLVERLVTTINSLDGDPVPLRFRPLAHVAGLPAISERGDRLDLPSSPDPRYETYRQLFDRIDVDTLVDEFERLEPSLEQAWQQLGEVQDRSFRQRVIDVSRHLADFELPAQPPELARPDVLYEYADPDLEALSWGRKVLIRVGPDHARAVQRKLDAFADRLANGGSSAPDQTESPG